MIDPKIIRENLSLVKDACKKRHYPLEFLNNLVEFDEKWRQALQEIEALKQQRNRLTPKGKPSPEELNHLQTLSAEIKNKNDILSALDEKTKEYALLIPNIPHASVPVGYSEDENIEIRQIGKPRSFSFSIKPHEELAKQLAILDFESAAKISGSRFVCYKNLGAKLERALINFMLDTQTKNGYQEIIPPVIVNSQSMRGTGQLPKFSADSFHLTDTDFWLSPTAEVQLTNMLAHSIIPENELPIKYTACTNCFRKEAGSYGKDISGIIRLHQFNKVELVKFVKPENSADELESLVQNAESILQALELPYRVVTLCTGDLGFSASKTYDLEVWFPAQKKYREISSCSNFLDFQARRAMIRYRQNHTEKVQYLHTLNGSGLAVGRTFAAILENYQNSDGSISIPKVLIPYLGKKEIKSE
jgi:seryl-tRNA synthetase